MKFKAQLFLIIGAVWISCSPANESKIIERPDEFTRIKYNNPGLEVDLGVGLWAWPLPIDMDGDGILDLVVACPDKPYNGLYLFKRAADNHLVLSKGEFLSKGTGHIQASSVNGEMRILGPGVEYRNFRDSLLNDKVDLFPAEILEKEFKKIRFRQWKYVDFENDGDLDLIVGIDEWGDYGWDNAFNDKGTWINGPLHGYVYLLENVDGKYENRGRIQAGGKTLDVYGAPTPNMEDFDGDGDLDLICGEFLDRLTYFENVGTREKPEFAEGVFLSNGDGVIKMDLEMIIPVSVDWDADGDIDLLVGDEDGRVAFIENTGKLDKGIPLFNSPVYLKQKADDVKFGALVTPQSVDWDGDGDEDLICGNTAGYIGFIENLSGGPDPKWAAPKYLEADGEIIRIQAGYNGSIQGPAEAKWGYTTLSVSDWNGDGKKDIIVNSIWGKVIWFENTGDEKNPKLAAAQMIMVDWPEGEIPKPAWNWWTPEANELSTQWRTTPQTIDWNKDGLMDLVMLDHEGILSYFERFEKDGKLFLHPGQRIFYGTNGAEFTTIENPATADSPGFLRNSKIAGGSGRRKWCFVDWDKDGDLDIIVNSKNASYFENTGTVDGIVQFTNHGNFTDKLLAGHTTSPTIVDWDKDGWPDLLLGAEDGYFYYLPNTKKEK